MNLFFVWFPYARDIYKHTPPVYLSLHAISERHDLSPPWSGLFSSLPVFEAWSIIIFIPEVPNVLSATQTAPSQEELARSWSWSGKTRSVADWCQQPGWHDVTNTLTSHVTIDQHKIMQITVHTKIYMAGTDGGYKHDQTLWRRLHVPGMYTNRMVHRK